MQPLSLQRACIASQSYHAISCSGCNFVMRLTSQRFQESIMKFLLALAFVGFAASARAQATPTQTAPAAVQAAASGTTRVQFKTSAVCDMCKARIEKSLTHEKGVQSAVLDVSTKVLTVTYKSTIPLPPPYVPPYRKPATMPTSSTPTPAPSTACPTAVKKLAQLPRPLISNRINGFHGFCGR